MKITLTQNKFNPNRLENTERVRRIKRLISGECKPKDFKDVFLEGCKCDY